MSYYRNLLKSQTISVVGLRKLTFQTDAQGHSYITYMYSYEGLTYCLNANLIASSLQEITKKI